MKVSIAQYIRHVAGGLAPRRAFRLPAVLDNLVKKFKPEEKKIFTKEYMEQEAEDFKRSLTPKQMEQFRHILFSLTLYDD